MPLPLLVTAALGLAAEYAPALVRALAGDDAAAVAEKVVGAAQVLTGTETPDAAMEALKANPELAAQYRTRMAELALEWEKVAAADRDSARKMQIETKSRMPAILAILLLATFIGEQAAIFCGLMPTDETAKAVILKGVSLLELALSLALGFYYGTSASSQRKDSFLAGKER